MNCGKWELALLSEPDPWIRGGGWAATYALVLIVTLHVLGDEADAL